MSMETKHDDKESTGVNDENNGGSISQKVLKPSETFLVSPKISLPILVMIDMFAVSLVVPLLQQYYQKAGVQSARHRELLSSLFSSSQIIGGLAIGALSDANILSRRNTLFLSFVGSALSYALLTRGDFPSLVISRIVVGLVKQTMTVTTSILARHTTKDERSTQMGRLTASTTAAWILGPSAGALLYKNVDPYAPAYTACGLFVLNSALAAILISADDANHDMPNTTSETSGLSSDGRKKMTTAKFTSFLKNLRSCFSSPSLARIVLSKLLFHWMIRATSYATMTRYYEDMYGIATHQRGYLASYQQLLTFLVQTFFVRSLLQMGGGERMSACISSVILCAANAMELTSSWTVFLVLSIPMSCISTAMLGLSLQSLLTQVAPQNSISSVLAAMDVLLNTVSVTVPFYRTGLFELMNHPLFVGLLSNAAPANADVTSQMQGDPNPRLWLASSALHWLLATLLFGGLLLVRKQHGGETTTTTIKTTTRTKTISDKAKDK